MQNKIAQNTPYKDYSAQLFSDNFELQYMGGVFVVFVNAEEIRACYDFACFAWEKESQSPKDFGGYIRDEKEFIADQTVGKIAEIIFKKHIESLLPNYKVHLNFEHYLDKNHLDNGDVILLNDEIQIPIRIDVKGSSSKAKWLVVEDYKYRNRNTNERISDCFVMVTFNDDLPSNDNLRANPKRLLDFDEIGGSIEGWAMYEDFNCSADGMPWFEFEKGHRLYNVNLLPKSPGYLNDRMHLQNYMNKAFSSHENNYYHIGPNLRAKKNFGIPLKWLREINNIENFIIKFENPVR